jgi:hypothetical protein
MLSHLWIPVLPLERECVCVCVRAHARVPVLLSRFYHVMFPTFLLFEYFLSPFDTWFAVGMIPYYSRRMNYTLSSENISGPLLETAITIALAFDIYSAVSWRNTELYAAKITDDLKLHYDMAACFSIMRYFKCMK